MKIAMNEADSTNRRINRDLVKLEFEADRIDEKSRRYFCIRTSTKTISN